VLLCVRSENKRTFLTDMLLLLHTALLKREVYSRVITFLEVNAERHCVGLILFSVYVRYR